MTPPPDGNHGRTIWRILQQISRNSSTNMDYSPEAGLIVPSPGIPEEGRLIPDAVFAPAELDVFHNAPSWMSPDGVELVLEVTSSRPDLDRNVKRRAYARAGIPLYLLVDRQHRRDRARRWRMDEHAMGAVAYFGFRDFRRCCWQN